MTLSKSERKEVNHITGDANTLASEGFDFTDALLVLILIKLEQIYKEIPTEEQVIIQEKAD